MSWDSSDDKRLIRFNHGPHFVKLRASFRVSDSCRAEVGFDKAVAQSTSGNSRPWGALEFQARRRRRRDWGSATTRGTQLNSAGYKMQSGALVGLLPQLDDFPLGSKLELNNDYFALNKSFEVRMIGARIGVDAQVGITPRGK